MAKHQSSDGASIRRNTPPMTNSRAGQWQAAESCRCDWSDIQCRCCRCGRRRRNTLGVPHTCHAPRGKPKRRVGSICGTDILACAFPIARTFKLMMVASRSTCEATVGMSYAGFGARERFRLPVPWRLDGASPRAATILPRLGAATDAAASEEKTPRDQLAMWSNAHVGISRKFLRLRFGTTAIPRPLRVPLLAGRSRDPRGARPLFRSFLSPRCGAAVKRRTEPPEWTAISTAREEYRRRRRTTCES
jgi:hypothetical protein